MSRREKRKKIEKTLRTVRKDLSLSLKEFQLLVDSILRKWKKEEDYFDYIVDYMYVVAYNHYKRYGSYIPVNKMLFLLSKYKNIDVEKTSLRLFYSDLTRKINKRVSTRIYRENLRKEKHFQEFLTKLLRYNHEGFISGNMTQRLCIFFVNYSLEDIEDNLSNSSLVSVLEDLLHDGKFAFPERVPAINVMLNFLLRYDSKVPDEDLDLFFKSVEDFVLV